MDPALLRALASPSMYPGCTAVEVHETHSSCVFVAGRRAYKVKKPVALGFLDYSTLKRRREACFEEVRVNRELAPGLYLGVRAIVRTAAGLRLAPDDAPDAVEYAVEMRTFGERDTFAGLIATGSLTPAHIVGVARLLADFHRGAPVVADWGPEAVLAAWRKNLREIEERDHPAGWRLDVATDFGEAFVERHAPELRGRAQAGLARDGHGDLRCQHVLANPSLRIVDRLEFDPRLRRADVAADLAFLAMDLEALGQRWAVRELYAAYRDAGMDPGGEALRCFYAAHCALVRAKVSLIAASEHHGDAGGEDLGAAQRLWSLGERLCWRTRGPLALVICGSAATGKSVLAAELAGRAEMTVCSSDAVRKRLAHLNPDEPAPSECYSADFTHATYERLLGEALGALGRGETAIVDATCRSRADRAPLFDGLRRSAARLLVVRCEVPLDVALQRAERRMHDPRRLSDATPRIAAEQFRAFDPLDELPDRELLSLDTTQTLDVQVAELSSAVDRVDRTDFTGL